MRLRYSRAALEPSQRLPWPKQDTRSQLPLLLSILQGMACKIMAACYETCRPARSLAGLSSFSSVAAAPAPAPAAAGKTLSCISDEVWRDIREEALRDVRDEPVLSSYYLDLILSHETLESALSSCLASKLSIPTLIPCNVLQELFSTTLGKDPAIREAVRADLRAARDRDPACSKMVHCFLYYKGFLAVQAHRVAHRLWADGRRASALLLQSRVSEVFAVDVHPGARIGAGVLMDHATGVVIGETAVVGNDVSILHGVTLGGTGKESGYRHPKVGDGVLIGAVTKVLGNVTVGECAKIGAGSVVLKPVPPRTTAVGNPARLVGGKESKFDI